MAGVDFDLVYGRHQGSLGDAQPAWVLLVLFRLLFEDGDFVVNQFDRGDDFLCCHIYLWVQVEQKETKGTKGNPFVIFVCFC